MSEPETEVLVRQRFPWLAEHRLILDEGDRPLVGGPAYVVSLSENQVVTVSASRPPRANLEEVQQQMRGGETMT